MAPAGIAFAVAPGAGVPRAPALRSSAWLAWLWLPWLPHSASRAHPRRPANARARSSASAQPARRSGAKPQVDPGRPARPAPAYKVVPKSEPGGRACRIAWPLGPAGRKDGGREQVLRLVARVAGAVDLLVRRRDVVLRPALPAPASVLRLHSAEVERATSPSRTGAGAVLCQSGHGKRSVAHTLRACCVPRYNPSGARAGHTCQHSAQTPCSPPAGLLVAEHAERHAAPCSRCSQWRTPGPCPGWRTSATARARGPATAAT